MNYLFLAFVSSLPMENPGALSGLREDLNEASKSVTKDSTIQTSQLGINQLVGSK